MKVLTLLASLSTWDLVLSIFPLGFLKFMCVIKCSAETKIFLSMMLTRHENTIKLKAHPHRCPEAMVTSLVLVVETAE